MHATIRASAGLARELPTFGPTMSTISTITAAGTASLEALRLGQPARSRSMRARGARLYAKLGATGVVLAVLVQVAGLCFCVMRAPAAADPHACCPRGTSEPGGSPASASLTGHTADCCPARLHAPTVVRLNEREPSPVPAPDFVSPVASFTALPGYAAPLGGIAAAARTSSPPRSPVLRI